MSSYAVSREDDPVDMVAVAADAELVENLRRALSPQDAVVWDDDDAELDPAVALLRSLQQDVMADLPLGLLPAGVTRLAPRRIGRTATIAAITAGVLSIGGVAAAASSPGSPLGGVRSAVSSAVSNVVDAITPDSPVGPAVTAPAGKDEPSPKATPPGELVSAAARSASAVTQITAELNRAGRLIPQGRYAAAKAQLDAADRKLTLVLDDAVRARLAARSAQLRALLVAAPSGRSQNRSGDDATTTSRDGESSIHDSTESGTKGAPARGSGASDDGTSGRGPERVEPPRSADSERSVPESAPDADPAEHGAPTADAPSDDTKDGAGSRS